MIKLPIGAVARFALKRIVLPAVARAVTDPMVPLSKDAAKAALERALQDEVVRQAEKRLG